MREWAGYCSPERLRVPWFNLRGKGICLSQSGIHYCTRCKDHTGRHHAAAVTGRVMAVWK